MVKMKNILVICNKHNTQTCCTGCYHSTPHEMYTSHGGDKCTVWGECCIDGFKIIKVECVKNESIKSLF